MRLAQLVEDVLQLARADAARGRLVLDPTDLTEMIRSVSETLFSSFAVEKNLIVNIDLGEDPVVIPMDGKQVNRVIRNIADNAARYTPENGEVKIRLALEKKMFLFCLNDSTAGKNPGPGNMAVPVLVFPS
jgi:signal transduction histidine kinase